jgi:monothiol glutaredoxin
MRSVLSNNQIGDAAEKAIQSFHPEIVSEIEKAIQANKYVIVGMAQNPIVSKARKDLDEAGLSYHYIEHGSYFSKWKQRLAIKLWSGWPTFPMVFIEGKLIGGRRELVDFLKTKKS